MKNFFVLSNALDYIEKNISENFTLDDVAYACSTSLSNLHKLFRYAFGYSLKEYIQKRRHCLACQDLIYTNLSVLQIALKYQYHSHEVFVRAFTKLRGETPTSYRKNHVLANLYPKLELNIGGYDMKKVDISDLYDVLKSLKNSYILCFDIVHFKGINDTYGFSIGDVVLAKTAERIENHLTNDMFLFRIGRDEFAVVTALYDEDKVKELTQSILNQNGEPLSIGDHQIPLSLRAASTRILEKELVYSDVLQNLQSVIDASREA